MSDLPHQFAASQICRLSGSTPPEVAAVIAERGRALILAAAVLDRPNADPDDDLSVLARQLSRAQEQIDKLRADLVYAYRCIDGGMRTGVFDFSVLRQRAAGQSETES